MPLKISSFKPSLPVMRKNFTRFWPVWASYLAIWILILPLNVLREGHQWGVSNQASSILRAGQTTSVILSVIFGFLSAAAVWNYLYNHRSVSLYHSLPVSRESMFLSHFLSGLGFMILPNLAVAVLTWLVCLGQGATSAASAVGAWLAAVCLQNLFYFCFATLLAMLTGNLPTHAVLYGILNLAGYLCELLIRSICDALIYGVYGHSPQFVFLSPPVRMLRTYVYSYLNGRPVWSQLDFPMLLGYAAVGLVMVVLALLLYRKRDSERAGDVIAVPFLRPVAKYCFALGCALVLGFLLNLVIFEESESFFAICVSMLLGGLIGYLTAAMLLKKSFRVFDKKNVLGFCALALVIVGTLTCMKLDLFRVGEWIPRKDRLMSADMYSMSNGVYWNEDQDPAKLDAILAAHRSAIREGNSRSARSTDVNVVYMLKSGRVVTRHYWIDASQVALSDPNSTASLLERMFSDPETLLKTNLPPEGATMASICLYIDNMWLNPHGETMDYFYLKSDDFTPVLDAIRADILAGDYGGWSPGDESYDFAYSIDLDYSFSGDRKSVV